MEWDGKWREVCWKIDIGVGYNLDVSSVNLLFGFRSGGFFVFWFSRCIVWVWMLEDVFRICFVEFFSVIRDFCIRFVFSFFMKVFGVFLR